MTKVELAACVAARAGIPKSEALEIVSEVFNVIAEKMADKEKIQIVGFGTFETKEMNARKGRNPHSGEELEIPAHTVPKFKAGKQLKDKIHPLAIQ